MASVNGKPFWRSHGTRPDGVNTIEDVYGQVALADLESLLIAFGKLAEDYAEKHPFHIGYAKLFIMDDGDRRVCDATYTASND